MIVTMSFTGLLAVFIGGLMIGAGAMLWFMRKIEAITFKGIFK